MNISLEFDFTYFSSRPILFVIHLELNSLASLLELSVNYFLSLAQDQKYDLFNEN